MYGHEHAYAAAGRAIDEQRAVASAVVAQEACHRLRIQVVRVGLDVAEDRARAQTGDDAAVAKNEYGEVITSSPGPMSKAISAARSASVPEDMPIANFTAQ